MADLLELGDLLALPPAVRYQVRVLARWSDERVASQLPAVIASGQGWFFAAPELAELGYRWIDARRAVDVRRAGCAWLAMFPSIETALQLGAIVQDPQTPPPVRDQAAWSLAKRQLRELHPATLWPAEAIQIADEALFALADAATSAGTIASARLPWALRHVASEPLSAVFGRAPGLWGDALECFATPPLARILLVSIDEIAPAHRIRALRLAAATLGEDAVPSLLAHATSAEPDEQLECLFLAVSLGGEGHLGRLEQALRGHHHERLLRERARWHLAHQGVVPTVRGLRVARTFATIAPHQRATASARAADDLAVLTRFTRHHEAYVYTLWGWMARAAADPERARALVTAYPAAKAVVRDLYLADLAARGQVAAVMATARELACTDRGALQLAMWGRPFAALELAGSSPHLTPELVCARALACYRAGRPDLADRVLADDLPPSEITEEGFSVPFPGPHERWLAEHAPTSHPAIAALTFGRNVVLGLALPAPPGAEPDLPSYQPITELTRRLERSLRGATVVLVGDISQKQRDAIMAALEREGARLVWGAVPGTDFYIEGDGCSPEDLARLHRHGLRRLDPPG